MNVMYVYTTDTVMKYIYTSTHTFSSGSIRKQFSKDIFFKKTKIIFSHKLEVYLALNLEKRLFESKFSLVLK